MGPQSLAGSQPPSYEPVPSVDVDEKAAATTSTPKNLEDGQPQPPRREMTVCRKAILALGLTWLVLFGVAIASPHPRWGMPCHQSQDIASQQQQGGGADAHHDSSSFAALLNAASPKSLHDLLHKYFPEKFQDGVYPSEREAVAAVHQANAALATSIVQLAKRDANTTSGEPTISQTSTSTSSSSTRPIESTTSTSVSTSSSRPTPTPSPTPTSDPGTSSSSSPPGNTRIPEDPSSSVPRTTVGDTTLSTSTITPDEKTSTSTLPPNTRRTSSPILTTLTRTSNGNVITVTSTTFVYDIPVETTTVDDQTGPTNTPSLQNGAVGGMVQKEQQRGSLLAGIIAVMGMFLI